MAAVNHWFLRKRGRHVYRPDRPGDRGWYLPLVALAVLETRLAFRRVPLRHRRAGVVPLVLVIRRLSREHGLAAGRRTPRPAPYVRPRDHSRAPAPKQRSLPPASYQDAGLLVVAAFHGLRNIPYAGVSVHLVPLLVWKGLDEHTAAFFVGLTAFSAVIIRP